MKNAYFLQLCLIMGKAHGQSERTLWRQLCQYYRDESSLQQNILTAGRARNDRVMLAVYYCQSEMPAEETHFLDYVKQQLLLAPLNGKGHFAKLLTAFISLHPKYRQYLPAEVVSSLPLSLYQPLKEQRIDQVVDDLCLHFTRANAYVLTCTARLLSMMAHCLSERHFRQIITMLLPRLLVKHLNIVEATILILVDMMPHCRVDLKESIVRALILLLNNAAEYHRVAAAKGLSWIVQDCSFEQQQSIVEALVHQSFVDYDYAAYSQVRALIHIRFKDSPADMAEVLPLLLHEVCHEGQDCQQTMCHLLSVVAPTLRSAARDAEIANLQAYEDDERAVSIMQMNMFSIIAIATLASPDVQSEVIDRMLMILSTEHPMMEGIAYGALNIFIREVPKNNLNGSKIFSTLYPTLCPVSMTAVNLGEASLVFNDQKLINIMMIFLYYAVNPSQLPALFELLTEVATQLVQQADHLLVVQADVLGFSRRQPLLSVIRQLLVFLLPTLTDQQREALTGAVEASCITQFGPVIEGFIQRAMPKMESYSEAMVDAWLRMQAQNWQDETQLCSASAVLLYGLGILFGKSSSEAAKDKIIQHMMAQLNHFSRDVRITATHAVSLIMPEMSAAMASYVICTFILTYAQQCRIGKLAVVKTVNHCLSANSHFSQQQYESIADAFMLIGKFSIDTEVLKMVVEGLALIVHHLPPPQYQKTLILYFHILSNEHNAHNIQAVVKVSTIHALTSLYPSLSEATQLEVIRQMIKGGINAPSGEYAVALIQALKTCLADTTAQTKGVLLDLIWPQWLDGLTRHLHISVRIMLVDVLDVFLSGMNEGQRNHFIYGRLAMRFELISLAERDVLAVSNILLIFASQAKAHLAIKDQVVSVTPLIEPIADMVSAYALRL